MSGPVAIIPVKRLDAAKQRLVEALQNAERAALVEAMLADVLDAVSRSDRLARVIVVTGDPRAERVALGFARQRDRIPIEVLADPGDRGHSEAAMIGIARANELGADAAALLPGDCPLLDPAELDAALERSHDGRVAIVPDRHGTGTNALVLSPPDAIRPAFGPGSCARHAGLGRRGGHTVEVERLESLRLDLDTPADLAEMIAALGRDPDRAPATASALERTGRLASASRR
jgi:2-phospho-L-lactate guanylyltransferase